MNHSSREYPVHRTPATFMVLIVLVLSMMACGDNTPSEKAEATGKAVGDAAEATGEAIGDAAEATGEAVGDAMKATGEFLTRPKDAEVKAAQETLDGIEKKWQELVAEAAPSSDETKVAFQEAKDQMAATLAIAKARLEEAEDASDEHWHQNVKPALGAALEKSQKLYDEAYAKFGGK